MEKAVEIIQSMPKKPEKQRELLSDINEIWKLNIDNTLLSELYGQAYARAIANFQDAKLRDMTIIVNPYAPQDRVSILFIFYSRWADRLCTYIISETRDISGVTPSEPARYENDRVTFDELPWIKDPNWTQFLRKSCEKVGPLSQTRQSTYHLSVGSWREPQWSIRFMDGTTGKQYSYSWDGKSEPIQDE